MRYRIVLGLGQLKIGMVSVARLLNGRWSSHYFNVNPGPHFTERPYALVEAFGAVTTVG